MEETHAERYLILTLSAEKLDRLRSFLNDGDLELAELDLIWDNMLVRAENPKVTRWYNLSHWVPEIKLSREVSSSFMFKIKY
jgi:hypothetical protein